MTIPVLTQWVANGVVVLFFPAAFNQIGKATTFSVLALMALLRLCLPGSLCLKPRTNRWRKSKNFGASGTSALRLFRRSKLQAIWKLSDIQHDATVCSTFSFHHFSYPK